MTNLTATNRQDVISLTPFIRGDERISYVDLKTNLSYFTQTSFALKAGVLRQTLAARLSDAKNNGIFSPLEGKIVSGSQVNRCQCYSVFQFTEYCKIYNPELVFGGEAFYVNAKELHDIGFIQHAVSPADQVVVSQAEADIESIKRLMGGVINTALALPGYNALGNSVGWVEPNFHKPSLTAREWVETHHPDLPLFSKTNMLRIGRAFSSAVIQNHQQLATNSWTNSINKYQESHHQVLCASFYNVSKLGLIA